MKGNPVLPGGSLKSKPTWWNTFGCSAMSAFFRLALLQPLASGILKMGGKTDVAKGRIKEAAGVLTGNDKLRA